MTMRHDDDDDDDENSRTFQALSRALNFQNQIHALSRISQDRYEP